MSIVYDGDGNRVSETVGGTTTKYLVSIRASLAPLPMREGCCSPTSKPIQQNFITTNTSVILSQHSK